MTTDEKFIDGKLQYDINREAAKISTLWSGKSQKCIDLTGEQLLCFTWGISKLHQFFPRKIHFLWYSTFPFYVQCVSVIG